MRRPPRSHLFRLYAVKEITVRQLAEHYGVTYGVARRWLLAHDIPLRPRGPERTRTTTGAKRGPKPSRPPNAATFRRRVGRMSLTELARAYDRDPRTIQAWADRAGLELLDGRRRNTPNAAELEALRADGMTLQAIGDRYGVSRQRVWQWLSDVPTTGAASDSIVSDDSPSIVSDDSPSIVSDNSPSIVSDDSPSIVSDDSPSIVSDDSTN